MNKNVMILTGEKQTGKTTFLTLWSKGKDEIDGILTPILNEQRHFYNINDGSDFLMEASEDEVDYYTIGRYRFSITAFEKASDLLWKKSNDPAIQTLVIDEIGPLELDQQKGLYDIFCRLLAEQHQQTLLIVVRPSLINKALLLLNNYDKQVKVIHLNEINPAQG